MAKKPRAKTRAAVPTAAQADPAAEPDFDEVDAEEEVEEETAHAVVAVDLAAEESEPAAAPLALNEIPGKLRKFVK